MPSKLNSHMGYLEIDHSNSPGIPAELAAKWAAQGIVVAGPGERLQRDTYSCPHCNAVVVKNPDRTRAREVCRKCMKVVCDKCSMWCAPFEGIVEGFTSGRLTALPSGLIVSARDAARMAA